MTRLWPAGFSLALLLCAGQAFAQSTPCTYSGVTFSSSGNITVTCGSGSYTATLSNNQTSCTYSAITINGSTGAVNATCTGSSPSSGVTFSIAAAGTASVGTPLQFTVTRNKGSGTLGEDTLTLAAVAGNTADTSFNPVSVSFGASEADGASRTPRVIFTKAGQAALTATSSGNTVTPSGTITVSGTSAGTCAGIPVPPYAADGGPADSDMGKHRLIAASASERATGAIRFTAPASGSLTFNVGAPGAGYPALSALDMTVSACPGDFAPASSACKVPGTNGKGVKITAGAADCGVQAGGTYYVNVRSATPGRDVGLSLSAQ